MKYEKLIILCKGNSVTGGSELVHQLCHELSNLNHKAYICYHPFDIDYKIPIYIKYIMLNNVTLRIVVKILLYSQKFQLNMHGKLKNQ